MKHIAFIIDTNPNYNATCMELYPLGKIEDEVDSVFLASFLKMDDDEQYNMGNDRKELTGARVIKSKLK